MERTDRQTERKADTCMCRESSPVKISLVAEQGLLSSSGRGENGHETFMSMLMVAFPEGTPQFPTIVDLTKMPQTVI